MSLFRRNGTLNRSRSPRVAPWPDMPPRPQRTETAQPQRDDLPRPDLSWPYPFQAAMWGGVDQRFDPCGTGPIKSGENT